MAKDPLDGGVPFDGSNLIPPLNNIDKADQLWGDTRKLTGPTQAAGPTSLGKAKAELVRLQLDEPTQLMVIVNADPGMTVNWSVIVCTQRGQLGDETPIQAPGAIVFAMSLRVIAKVANGSGQVEAQATRMTRGR